MPIVSSASAEAPLTLAVDLGTSSFRALLFDRHGRAVDGSEEQRGYELVTSPDGGAEADARIHGGGLVWASRSIRSTCLSALVADCALEAWYHPSIA